MTSPVTTTVFRRAKLRFEAWSANYLHHLGMIWNGAALQVLPVCESIAPCHDISPIFSVSKASVNEDDRFCQGGLRRANAPYFKAKFHRQHGALTSNVGTVRIACRQPSKKKRKLATSTSIKNSALCCEVEAFRVCRRPGSNPRQF